MSRDMVRYVTLKMVGDPDFRGQLLADVDGTVQAHGYDLTEDEIQGFRELSQQDFGTTLVDSMHDDMMMAKNLSVAGTLTWTDEAH